MTPLPEKLIQRHPLIPVETAAILSDCTPDKIREQIEFGKLIAFDLRTANSRTRSCLRVLAQSLNGRVNDDDVLNWIPAWNPTGVQLTRLFSVSQWLISALLLDGLLKQVGTPSHAKESPRIDRESLVFFLKSRWTGATLIPPSNRPRVANAPHAKSSHGLHTRVAFPGGESRERIFHSQGNRRRFEAHAASDTYPFTEC